MVELSSEVKEVKPFSRVNERSKVNGESSSYCGWEGEQRSVRSVEVSEFIPIDSSRGESFTPSIINAATRHSGTQALSALTLILIGCGVSLE